MDKIDWTLILVNCVVTLPATIAAMVAAMVTIHNHIKSRKWQDQTQKGIVETQRVVNGRMDDLVHMAESKGKAEGQLEEIREQEINRIPQPPTELRADPKTSDVPAPDSDQN